MINTTKIERPSTTYTKVAKPTSGVEGRFGIGKFGSARFGTPDIVTKVAKPSTTYTKIERPA